jgi:DNA-binding NtrC family response regulator
MARILVVDDDAALLKSISRYLRTLGHEVAEAADGRKAVTALRAGPVDVVLTDINMPEMDGIELLAAVRAEDARVPVIAISGGGIIPKELLLGGAGMLGAFSTLPKPLELDQLKAVVEGALEARSRGQTGEAD